MRKSNQSILKHIPLFLAFCRKKGLSNHTYKNYQRYLEKFKIWLKKNNKESLRPHEFSVGDVTSYKQYLASYRNKNGEFLKTISQNYYLIALRAILSYLRDQEVECLPFEKITLPKGIQSEKTIKYLNLAQVEAFLKAPNTREPSGLRDKAILATIIYTGFKISQLVKLNRDNLDNIPGQALPYIKSYLATRDDENKALFIHYRARKGADKRLTNRSIERVTNKYGREIGLPFSITPELLRWSRAQAFLNEKVKIQILHTHKTFILNNYKIGILPKQANYKTKTIKAKDLSPTWHHVEGVINKEVSWLKNNIWVLPDGYRENPPFLKCDDCLFRNLAILIASGRIKAAEFQPVNNEDLWNGLTEKLSIRKISRHGADWHQKMMNIIYERFKSQRYDVVLEPILDYGRADLGVSLNTNNPLYVEVGTVSLFKLWYNLLSMRNTTFLIVPSEDKIIEFKT